MSKSTAERGTAAVTPWPTSGSDFQFESLSQVTSRHITQQLVIDTDTQRAAFVDALTRWSGTSGRVSTETFSVISRGSTVARLGGVVDLLDEAIAMFTVSGAESGLETVIGQESPVTVPASWVEEMRSIGIIDSSDNVMDWYDSQPPA